MAKKDPRVDAYISKSAPFAQPILKQIRTIVHEACPEVEEGLKWSMPHFGYKGMMCGMAAFKAHATFGFWKSKLILPAGKQTNEEAMGQFGRLTSVEDLPPKRVLAGYIKQAMKLNEQGTMVAKPRKAPKPPPRTPADLAAALKKNAKARKTWEGFPPSHKREYVDWITEAKSEETRTRRLDQTIEWVAEGKQRNWKYMNC